jgi:hypothetical protein
MGRFWGKWEDATCSQEAGKTASIHPTAPSRASRTGNGTYEQKSAPRLSRISNFPPTGFAFL